MSSDENTAQTLRQYLLGTLPEAARQPVEERLLTDRPFFEELLAAEDELIDEYLAGTLSPAAIESFTGHFLQSDERQSKLQFARAFRRYVAAHAPVAAAEPAPEPELDSPLMPGPTPVPPPAADRWSLRAFFSRHNPGWAFALVAALLVVVAGITWLAALRPRPHGPGRVVAISLTPGLVRAAGTGAQLVLMPGTDTAELHLELSAAEYPGYRADVQTAEGRTVYTAADLKPTTVEGRRVIVVQVPGEALPAGDYQLRLSGTNPGGNPEPAGRYYFRVSNK